MLDLLRSDALASHAALGRQLELSASSVRRRLGAMQDSGFLRGFVALPAPNVLGLQGIAATWKARASAGALLALPGTIMAGNSVGGGTLAGGFAAREGDWLAAANAVVGEDATTATLLPAYDGPTLGPLELRIIRAMVPHPRASAEALADAAGLSAKTVRKRRATLLERGAVQIHPIIQTGASDDLVYHLHVTCTAEQVSEVMACLQDAGEISCVPDDGPILCAFVRAPSLRRQAETLARLRTLRVANVEVVHEHEWEIDTERLVGFVDAALARWQRA